MSGTVGNCCRPSESAENQRIPNMRFWGICCESGKHYEQCVKQRFRVTMAVLDPKSFRNDESERTVSLKVLRKKIEYLLCVLKHGEIYQVNLNLIFDKGEKVRFYIQGHGKVFLSGYQLTDSAEDVRNDEIGYLCPLVEVQPHEQSSMSDKSGRPVKFKTDRVKSESIIPVSEGRAKGEGSVILRGDDDDDDDDESDEDFSAADEETSSETASSDEIDLEELNALQEDLNKDYTEEEDEEEQIIQNSHESRRKRKMLTNTPPEKRSRKENFNNTSGPMASSEEVICIEDNGDDERGGMNASTSSGKKSKNKKRLSEISNLSMASNDEQQPKVGPPKNKHPVLHLSGGVEIQDVVLGKGPTATKGKMLHVFYVGRLPDKSVFDSRLPGKKPFSFKLGANQVITGWDVGLEGMKVGGKRKIKVPPRMTYKDRRPEGIPANTTLYFVVELQGVS